MRIWRDESQGYEVHIFPQWTKPIACYAEWPGGHALVVLGTWDSRGDALPADFLESLKSREEYLYDWWAALHP